MVRPFLADSLRNAGGCPAVRPSRVLPVAGNAGRRTGHRENDGHEHQDRIAKSSTARKVVGSLGVIGAAAAVAGMGTFGTFTDSTTPVTTTVASGTRRHRRDRPRRRPSR